VTILIKAIVLDFGGVYFTYSRERRLKAFKNKIPLSEKLIDRAWSKYIHSYNTGKISEKEFWKRFRKELGISISNKELREAILSVFKPIKGVHIIAERLRKKIKVGLLTDHSNWLDVLDKMYGVYKNFDEVVVSYKVGIEKPKKKIYELMLRKLKVEPSEVVFIDDDRENTKVARKLGMKTILFKSSPQLKKELKKLRIL